MSGIIRGGAERIYFRVTPVSQLCNFIDFPVANHSSQIKLAEIKMKLTQQKTN